MRCGVIFREMTYGVELRIFFYRTLSTFFCFQIECLVLDEQFKKVSVYANHLLNWMTKHKACGIQGYYASNHPDKYSLLQVITTDVITRCDNMLSSPTLF